MTETAEERIDSYVHDILYEKKSFSDVPKDIRDSVKSKLIAYLSDYGNWCEDDGLSLKGLPEDICANRDVISNAVEADGENLQYASEELRSDWEFVLAAIEVDGKNLQYASEELRSDPEFVLAAIWSPEGNVDAVYLGQPMVLFFEAIEFASESIRSDPEFVREAVKLFLDRNPITGFEHESDFHPLACASEKLQADPQIIRQIFKQTLEHLGLDKNDVDHEDYFKVDPFPYVSPELRADKDFMLKLIQETSCGLPLRHASHDLQNDRDLMLAALSVSVPFDFFYYRHDEDGFWIDVDTDRSPDFPILADWEVALAVLVTPQKTASWLNDHVLERLSEGLQTADREVVMAAVRTEGNLLKYAPEGLRADREVVLTAVEKNGHALEYAAETLKNDRTVVMAAVRSKGNVLKYAPEDLRADREVVLTAVEKNGHALKYAAETLKNDRTVVMAAVRQNGGLLQHASKRLRSDTIMRTMSSLRDLRLSLSDLRLSLSNLRRSSLRRLRSFIIDYNPLLLLYLLIPVALFLIGWETAAVLSAPFCFLPFVFRVCDTIAPLGGGRDGIWLVAGLFVAFIIFTILIYNIGFYFLDT